MTWNRDAFTRPSRRAFLRGLGLGAAGAFLSPTLSRLRAEANGGEARKRFVFVLESNGMFGFENWTRLRFNEPRITDLNADYANTAPVPARALEPFKDRVVAINGLANKQGNGKGAGHRAHYYALSCVPYAPGGGSGDITIDQLLAQGVGAGDIFPSVLLGAASNPNKLQPANSALGPNTPVSVQCDPIAAYSEIFGAAAPDPELRKAFTERKKLMDFISGDIKKVQPQLAAEERWKFDRYLHSVETFQSRQVALEQARDTLQACIPDNPALREVFSNRAPEFMDSTDLDLGDYATLQFDLATQALICGLTHVAVLSVGSVVGVFDQFLNWGFGPRHSTGHGQFGGGEALAECSNKISELIAEMATRLDAIPEGDGTMLDNTVIVFINDNGDHHHSKYDNWPLIVLGDAGGALDMGGRLIEYPNQHQPGARGVPQLWNTLLYAAGMEAEIEGFAQASSAPREGLLDELIA
jgi:hypothetical protein